MEKEQASSTMPSGQNSAQSPPPTPSSSISPRRDEGYIATNNTKGNLRVEPKEEEEQFLAETSPVALPILGKNKHIAGTTAAAANDDDLTNPSPLTNLSRHAITNEMVFGPIPDREYHEGFMRKAIEMAQLALDSDETPVGCVFVRDGEVIGRGINGTNASLNVSVTFPSLVLILFAGELVILSLCFFFLFLFVRLDGRGCGMRFGQLER